jgi:hypothetical protein
MKEGLFLDRIALNTADVTPGHEQRTAPVETHPANPGLPFWYRTTVSAGVTADTVAIKRFPQNAFSNVLRQNFPKRPHNFFF